jgi:hypothetical protein
LIFFCGKNFAILLKEKIPTIIGKEESLGKIFKKIVTLLRKKSYEIGKIFEGFGQGKFLAFFY